jgi:hypothetical protein
MPALQYPSRRSRRRVFPGVSAPLFFLLAALLPEDAFPIPPADCRMDGGVPVTDVYDSLDLNRNFSLRNGFKEVFLIHRDDCKAPKVFPYGIGMRSYAYAIQRRGHFNTLTVQDVYAAQKGNVEWSDLERFLAMGRKLRNPGTLEALADSVGHHGLRSAKALQKQGPIPNGPWDGLFLFRQCDKAWIYSIQYAATKDSLKLAKVQPYFSFDLPSSDEVICNPSAVYYMPGDSLKWVEWRNLSDFEQANRE